MFSGQISVVKFIVMTAENMLQVTDGQLWGSKWGDRGQEQMMRNGRAVNLF